MSQQEELRDTQTCPLSEAAILLNSKWDLVVVYNLLEKPLHFSELKEKISTGLEKPVTSSSLTRILRKLEKEGIVARDVSAETGESVEIIYSLSQMGKDLEETIQSLKKWGIKYLA